MPLSLDPRVTGPDALWTTAFAALVSWTLPGCGGDDGAGSTGGGSTTVEVVTTSVGDDITTSESGTTASASSSSTSGETTGVFHLSGSVAYERVPFDYAGQRLDYTNTEALPMRGVTVRLLDIAGDEEIASVVVGDDGAYAFEYEGVPRVKLRIYAETTVPPIVVEDNTDGDAIYVLESEEVDSAAAATLDVLATSGWTGAGYGEPRFAAPFAVLDAAYRSGRRFLDETSPAPEFAPLIINWSAENRPEGGDVAAGQIGTSYWDFSELYLLGKEDIDTDEYDSFVIVHEWCHYYQSTISRTDSIGGGHGGGDVVDPRVAWGEGVCNGMSAVIHHPIAVYYDSMGPGQSGGFSNDFEADSTSPEANPGWFEENTVARLVYDLYDGANEPFDRVELGLQGVHDGMLALRGTPALVTVFTFLTAIKAGAPAAVADIDALTVHNELDADFGVSVVKDEWGTDESHDAGVVDGLPVYTDAGVGDMITVNLAGDYYNRLTQNRFYRIVGDGMRVTVQSMCASDVDLFVYHHGEVITYAVSGSGDESIAFDTIAGETYVLTVGGYGEAPGPYAASLAIDHEP